MFRHDTIPTKLLEMCLGGVGGGVHILFEWILASMRGQWQGIFFWRLERRGQGFLGLRDGKEVDIGDGMNGG